MSLKAKLVSSVAAFMLVIALLVVGVLAASQVTVNLGGSLTFNATDVNATVEVTVTGTTETTQPSKTFVFSGNDAENSNLDEESTDTATWNNLAWTFDNDAREIVITIKITNNDDTRSLNASLTTPAAMTAANVNVVSKQDQTTLTNGAASTATTVTAGKSLTYTISFTIADENEAVSAASATWTASLVLNDGAAE